MTAACAHGRTYQGPARPLAEKASAAARRRRRLDRERLAKPLVNEIRKFYDAETEKLIEFLEPHFALIQSYFVSRYPLEAMRRAQEVKGISPADFDFLMRILQTFGQFADSNEFASTVIDMRLRDSYEAAARFALEKLGYNRVAFNLRNPNLLESIRSRALSFPESASVRFDQSIDTLVNHFVDQGRAPYDSRFLRDIMDELGYDNRAAALRFAQTETGIITNQANYQSYQKMEVERKEWLTAIRNVRPTHAALSGIVIDMDDKFDVGGNPASYPQDPSLPPEELINCRCDMAPIIERDPDRPAWTGD